jgi:hypothetical protein
MSDPMRAVKDATRGIASHDSIKSAEARAEMAAISNAMKAQVEASPVAPPAGERDPRPLAETIVGTWSNPIVTLTFGPDGALAITTSAGQTRPGHWSVDSAGKLVSDAAGGREAADAWITGGELTISMRGEAMKFRKAGP